MALRMTIFFLVLTTVVGGIHAYVGWRALAHARLGKTGRRRVWILLALSAASILVAFVAGRVLEYGLTSSALAWVGFVLLGTIGVFFALYVARDVVLLGARLLERLRSRTARAGAEGPTRREVLHRGTNLAVLGAGGLVVGGSLVQAHRTPVVEHVPVAIEGLSSALEGFRIVQISDLHIGPTLGRTFSAEVAGIVNGLDADLVAVTGDLVDGRVGELSPEVEPLAAMRASLGVYFVTGNHEYYWDAPAWLDYVTTLGWVPLVNEHRLLSVRGAVLAVGGVTDVSAGGFYDAHASDAVKAFAGAPDDAAARILLAHQPRSLYGAQEANVDLQLSGHTHGGQVFPMNLLVHLAHPIVEGLGRFGRTQVYVNRGTAYWGPPMRTGRPGEVTLVELGRA